MRRAFCFAAVAVSLFLSSPNPGFADDYLEGVEAFEQGDHALALSFWLPLAEAGDGRAQYSLGKLYEIAEQDDEAQYEEAIKWYLRAADQGGAAAQNNLGRLFAQGLGTKEDKVKAVDYWQQAAQSKHAMAQYNLGLAYFRGEGVERNVEQAVFWFHQSANNGVAGAHYALGEVYRLGLSVPVDLVEAHKWYQKSAEAGNTRAVAKVEEVAVLISQARQTTEASQEDLAQESDQTQETDLAQEIDPSQTQASGQGAVPSQADASQSKGQGLGERSSPQGGEQAVQAVGNAEEEPKVLSSDVAAVAAVEEARYVDLPKPVKNPRGYTGVGSLLVNKPKSNPRR